MCDRVASIDLESFRHLITQNKVKKTKFNKKAVLNNDSGAKKSTLKQMALSNEENLIAKSVIKSKNRNSNSIKFKKPQNGLPNKKHVKIVDLNELSHEIIVIDEESEIL